MSLVMGILQNDFVMFCSDSRLNGYDNNSYTVQKVFKYNENIIYAIGGDKETVDSIIEITRNICGENASYEDFSNTVEYIFRNLPLKDTKNISIFIGGISNDNLSMKIFYVFDNKLSLEIHITPIKSNPIRKVFSSDISLHANTIQKYFPKRAMTINEIINSFQIILDLGSSIDTTIDNKIQYLYIKKVN